MSWFKVAMGLLSSAVGTDAGREVLSNVRSAIRKDPPSTETPPQGFDVDLIQSAITRHRQEIDRNIETVVQMLNLQNQALEALTRRQQKWNIALAASVVIAIAIALFYEYP